MKSPAPVTTSVNFAWSFKSQFHEWQVHFLHCGIISSPDCCLLACWQTPSKNSNCCKFLKISFESENFVSFFELKQSLWFCPSHQPILIFRKQRWLSNSAFYPAHKPRKMYKCVSRLHCVGGCVRVSVLHSLTRLAHRMIQISLIKSWSFAKKVKYDNYPDDGSCQSEGKQRLGGGGREARAGLHHATLISSPLCWSSCTALIWPSPRQYV